MPLTEEEKAAIAAAEALAAAQAEEDDDLLTGTQEADAAGTGEAGDEGDDDDPVDLKPALATVQETLQDKAEKIEQYREENEFLGKQIVNPDPNQFEKGGIYEDLPTYTLGTTLLYKCTPAQIDAAIAQIESSDDLEPARKRSLLRTIDTALAVFEDRKKQHQKQIELNMKNANVQEWQQVELGFKDAKTGIKGIDKHIPQIWEWCKKEMEASRSLNAKCEASLDEKFKLAVRAIRELKIDKKLGKDLSGEDRPGLDAPLGQSASRGVKRGASTAQTFTRAQLKEFQRNPGKVDEKLMAAINKATAEGRIKD